MRCDRTWQQRLRDEGGNTLVLFPAAILILLGLGALALDSATIYLGQRRLADLAAATANDAAGGLLLESFYDEDADPVLDRDLGDRRARVVGAQMGEDRSFEAVECTVEVVGLEATADCTAQVRPILAPFWLGSNDRLTMRAIETARAAEGPLP
ncbi:MAG: hypothetical protein LC679_17150 [Intrasporangiaceae bacterium]|nr:hypothetical protein [Intrasporangiaceae bacterium]